MTSSQIRGAQFKGQTWSHRPGVEYRNPHRLDLSYGDFLFVLWGGTFCKIV